MKCRRAVVAVLAAATLAGCGAAGGDKAGGTRDVAPVVLSLAHALDDAALRPFLDEVARASGGRLRIEPHAVPHRRTGDDERAVVEDVRAGRADLGIAQRGDPAELEVVGQLPGPFVRPVGTNRALLGPETYRGARIAVRGADPANTSLVALSATTVLHDLRGGDIATVDGLAAPVSAISDNVYDGVATRLTANVVLGIQELVIFGRPGASGEILRTAARTAQPAMAQFRRAEERTAMTALCRRGQITLETATEVDLEALRDLLGRDPRASEGDADTLTCDGVDGGHARTLIEGEYEITTDTGTSRLILDRGQVHGDSAGSYVVDGDIVTLTYPAGTNPVAYRWNPSGGELTLTPVVDAGSPATQRTRRWRRVGDAPVADRTPIDGVYAAGEVRWTLNRGQFDQTSDDGLSWTSGGYSVDGDILTATYAQIDGDQDLTAGQVRRGDTMSYRWNVYRGRLHLSPVDGALSPAVFSATAWRRVGDPP